MAVRAVSASLAEARPCEGEPVLLAAPDIRRWVRKILEVPFPKLSVVSPYELVPEAPLEILGTIDAHDASPTLQ